MKKNEQMKREYKAAMEKIRHEINSAFLMLLAAMAMVCGASAVSGAEAFDMGIKAIGDAVLPCVIFALAAFLAKTAGLHYISIRLREYFYEKYEESRRSVLPQSTGCGHKLSA